jgi:hypothetical protein
MGVNNPNWTHVGTNKEVYDFTRRPYIGDTDVGNRVFGPYELPPTNLLGQGSPVLRQLGVFAPQQWTVQVVPEVSPIGGGTQYTGAFGVQGLLTINSQTPGN